MRSAVFIDAGVLEDPNQNVEDPMAVEIAMNLLRGGMAYVAADRNIGARGDSLVQRGFDTLQHRAC